MFNQKNPLESADADSAVAEIASQQLDYLKLVTPEPTGTAKLVAQVMFKDGPKWASGHDTYEQFRDFQNDHVDQSNKNNGDRQVFNTMALMDSAKWKLHGKTKKDWNTGQYVDDPKVGQPKAERSVKSAHSMQSFWLDIDFKDGYRTYDSALAAWREFLDATNGESLEYLVVNSGGGIHIYLPLTEPISAADWQIQANRFDALVKKHGLKADSHCTTDQARFLRMPWTTNFKDDYAPDFKVLEWKIAPDEPNDLQTVLDWFDANDIKESKADAIHGTKHQVLTAEPMAEDKIYANCAVVREIAKEIDGKTEGRHDDFVKVASQYAYVENGGELLRKIMPNYMPEREAEYHDPLSKKWFDTWHRGATHPHGCKSVSAGRESTCAGCPMLDLGQSPFDSRVLNSGSAPDQTGKAFIDGLTGYLKGPAKDAGCAGPFDSNFPVIMKNALEFMRLSYASHSDNNIITVQPSGSKVKIEKTEATRGQMMTSAIGKSLFKSHKDVEKFVIDAFSPSKKELHTAIARFKNTVIDMIFVALRTHKNVATMHIAIDHFATQTSIVMEEMNIAEMTIPTPPFGKKIPQLAKLANGMTAEDVWLDYVNFNPQIVDLLNFIIAAWFASNSRKGSIWLHAEAGSGKTLLFEGILHDMLNLVWKTNMATIKKLQKGDPSPVAPETIIGKPVVFIDEATGGGAKELKDMNLLPVAAKNKMQQQIRTYCRVLASKETLEQLVGSGVEPQFADRFSYIKMTGGKIESRPLFKMLGQAAYVNALGHKINDHLQQQVKEYKKDPGTATLRADEFMAQFHERRRITNFFDSMEDTLYEKAVDIFSQIVVDAGTEFSSTECNPIVLIDKHKDQRNDLFLALFDKQTGSASKMVVVPDFRKIVESHIGDEMTKIKISQSTIVDHIEEMWIKAGGKPKAQVRYKRTLKKANGEYVSKSERKTAWAIEFETLKNWSVDDLDSNSESKPRTQDQLCALIRKQAEKGI